MMESSSRRTMQNQKLLRAQSLPAVNGASHRQNKKQNDVLISHSHIEAVVPAICAKYNNGNCSDKSCSKLHICKEYMIQKIRCNQQSCSLSHSFNTNHNFKILSALYSYKRNDNIFNDLQNKYLRICKNMQSNGSCKNSQCNQLHICPMYLFGDCLNVVNCNYPHSLKSNHNQKIFQRLKLTGILSTLDNIDILQYILVTQKLINEHFPMKNQRTKGTEKIKHKEPSSPMVNPFSVKKDRTFQLESTIKSKEIFIQNQRSFPPRLCFYYLEKGSCNKGNDCTRLHICKEYLMQTDKCFSTKCRFGYIHDLFDANNLKIIRKHFDQLTSESDILEKLSKSYPKICTNYGDKKICQDKQCSDLHLCPHFVFKTCCDTNCKLSHDYDAIHNKDVFERFNLSSLLKQNQKSSIPMNVFSTLDQFVVKESKAKRSTITLNAVPANQIEQLRIKEMTETQNVAVKEDVIAFILEKDPKGGRCPLNQQELLKKFFHNSVEVAEKWFNEHRGDFYIKLTLSKKFVNICMVDVEPCLQYWRKNGCTKQKCGRFHICRRLLFQPHNSNGCKFNHDISSQNFKELKESNKISHLSSDQLLTVLRKRCPVVCSKYQETLCSNGEVDCEALHICKDFILGKCSKEDHSCVLAHESALTGAQAKHLSDLFNIPFRTFRSFLLVQPDNYDMEDIWNKDKEAVELKPVDKRNIIYFIINLNPTGAKISLKNRNLLSYFSDSKEIAENWFQKNHSFFRMSFDNHTVHVCIVDVEPCQMYWNTGCPGNCGRFHICKKLLFEKHNANTCSFNHNFDDINSQNLIKKNKLQGLSSDQLIVILKNRFPFVCENYQTGKCLKGEEYCEDLHVCKDYLTNDCEGWCSRLHSYAFLSNQAKRICSNFSLNGEKLRNFVLYQSKCEMVTDEAAVVLKTIVAEPVVNEREIIRFIVNQNPTTAQVSLSNPTLLSYFNDSKRIAEKWFRNTHSLFRMSFDDYTVHVCIVDLEPCKMYWNVGCTGNCGRFHICKKLFFEKHNANTCSLNHGFTDMNSQNLIKKNKLQGLSSGQLIAILKNRFPFVCESYQTGKCLKGEEYCEDLHVCKDFLTNDCKRFCSKLHSNAFQSNQAKIICSKFSLDEGNLINAVLYQSKVEMLSDKAVKEKEIIQFIVNQNPTNAKVSLRSPELLLYFDNSREIAKKWFQINHSLFRMSFDNHTVYVCIVDVEPCKLYWTSDCSGNCARFHICRKLLFEKHNANTCSFNHSLNDKNSQILIKKSKLHGLSSDQLIAILRNRFPFVCENYQAGMCLKGEGYCDDLHVCKDYLANDCKESCSRMHDYAFQSIQAQRICSSFSLNKKHLKNVVLYQRKIKMVTESKSFNALKEEAICLDYLNGNCYADDNCLKVHSKIPFLWQFQPDVNSDWQDVLSKENIRLEKQFCGNNEVGHGDDCMEYFYDEFTNAGIVQAANQPKRVRRLSTRSSVLNSPKNYFGTTKWKWYWQESPSKWTEYSNWTDSSQIEKSYLSGDRYYKFTTDQFTYQIFFNEMVQQNCDERYFTRRKIRRRPVFQDNITKKSLANKSGIQYPSTWPTTCKPGHLINVTGSTKDNLEKGFIKSISNSVTSVKVLTIEEVCNHEFYEKYEIKKNQIKKKGTDIGEKCLYHGTSYDTVKNICAQNFDFRMCGKNATMYGKGSYFSTSASYSHSYSSSDSNNIFYMFIGQVITGKYIQGNSSYTRPPPLHSGSLELYDSCVDNINKPSMYIIFDRDQCYPRYLISYKVGSSNNNNLSSIRPRPSVRQSNQLTRHSPNAPAGVRKTPSRNISINSRYGLSNNLSPGNVTSVNPQSSNLSSGNVPSVNPRSSNYSSGNVPSVNPRSSDYSSGNVPSVNSRSSNLSLRNVPSVNPQSSNSSSGFSQPNISSVRYGTSSSSSSGYGSSGDVQSKSFLSQSNQPNMPSSQPAATPSIIDISGRVSPRKKDCIVS